MLRMHTRTVEVVEGSLIAMIDVCVPERLGEDGINAMVGFIWLLHNSSGISHAGIQTSSYPKTGCRHGCDAPRAS